MSDQVKKIIENIVNPATGKTLVEESRIIDIKEDNDSLKIKYSREFISPSHKEIINAQLKKNLAFRYRPSQIHILSVNSKEHDKSGTVGNKKTIPQVKKIIAISSAKGGVGKSTVAANLAVALGNLKYKVGLIDADIYGPSIPMILGKRKEKPMGNNQKKIIPIHAWGICFISFGLFVDEKDPVIWRGPMLGGVLNQFLFDVSWGELDYLLIDLPPGTGDMQLSLGQSVKMDGVIAVSTPQEVALLDTKKGISMFDKVGIPCLGIIQNMSSFITPDSKKTYYIFGKEGVKKAAKELGITLLGSIPLEMGLRESCDSGIPYMANNDYKNQSVWKSYMEITKKIDTILKGEKNFLKKCLLEDYTISLIFHIKQNHISGFTGKINVLYQNNHQFIGAVLMIQGQVVHAYYQGIQGRKALTHLFFDNQGDDGLYFICEPEIIEPDKINFHLSFNELKKISTKFNAFCHRSKKLRPPGHMRFTINPRFITKDESIHTEEFSILTAVAAGLRVDEIYQKIPLREFEITNAFVSLKDKKALFVSSHSS